MNDSIAERICSEYGLALQSPIQPIERGYLSNNFYLQGEIGSYFLKQYRYSQPDRVLAAHEAKFFFAAANVPVILPLRTVAGASFFDFEQRYFALFPYIEGRHLTRGCFSEQAITSCAEMLSRIHRAGKNPVVHHIKPRMSVRNKAHFEETAHLILERIDPTRNTEFDQLALETIRLKLRLADRHQNEFAGIDLPSDHLVHGDFQDANLFFDAEDKVSHLFDWELTRIVPRGLELVRAIEFICFANPENFKAIFSVENYEKARCYLQHYHDRYPIERNEFEMVWRARYFDKLLSLWVEEDHYLAGNPRVDPFLESEYHTTRYYAEHLAAHIERLSEGILK